MAKENSQHMRVSPRFRKVAKDISQQTQIPIVKLTDNLGKQLEEQVREGRKFQPRFPTIKLRKITDKKGSALDVIWVFVAVFVIALTFLVITKIWDGVENKVRFQFNSSITERVAVNKLDAVVGALDNYFLIILMLGTVAIIVLASLIRADPVFYWIFFFIFIIGLIMAAVFSNAYESFTSTSAIDASNFDVQNYVMANLPIIFVILGLILLIVIYGKTRSGV